MIPRPMSLLFISNLLWEVEPMNIHGQTTELGNFHDLANDFVANCFSWYHGSSLLLEFANSRITAYHFDARAKWILIHNGLVHDTTSIRLIRNRFYLTGVESGRCQSGTAVHNSPPPLRHQEKSNLLDSLDSLDFHLIHLNFWTLLDSRTFKTTKTTKMQLRYN
jgi:hypothetical protein